MAAQQNIYLKRGATLSLAGYVNLPEGPWTATSEVKNSDDVLVDSLTVSLTAPVSPSTIWTLSLSATAEQTIDWPLGPLSCDIRFTNTGAVLYSPTFIIFMQKEITDV